MHIIYGSWYCPYVPNPVPVEVWKAERIAQLQAKKAARQQQLVSGCQAKMITP